MPTSEEIKAARRSQISGNSLSINVTALLANTPYYGWAMLIDDFGNESVIIASTSTVLMTTPVIFINEGVLDPRIMFTLA